MAESTTDEHRPEGYDEDFVEARNPMDKFSFSFKRNQFKESKIYMLFINLSASSK